MSATQPQSLIDEREPESTPVMPAPAADHSDDQNGDRGNDDGEETEEEYFGEEDGSDQPAQSSSTPKRQKSSSRVRAILLDKPQRASKLLAPHDAAFKAAVEHGLEIGERPKRRSVPTPRFGTQHSKTPTLHLERDAAIMQHILDKRPYVVHRPKGEKELLDMVVKALKPNVVWGVTKASVQNQIKWLVHVLLDETHAEHGNLMAADALRDMVKEYHDVSDAVLEDFINKMDDPEGSEKRTFDDVLLRGVRRSNPFTEQRKRFTNAVWDAFAATLNEELQAKVFFSGMSCKDRLLRLRAVARGRHDPHIELTSAQRAMLDELEAELGGKRRRDSVDGDGDDDDSIPMDIDIQSLETEDEASDREDEVTQAVKRTRRRAPEPEAKDETAIPPNADRNSIAQERFAFDQERQTLEYRVLHLERELGDLRRSQASLSAEWMQRLETERTLHREQVESLLSLLRAERDAQRQETCAVLDTIAAERREQFMFMRNALSQAPSGRSGVVGGMPRAMSNGSSDSSDERSNNQESLMW